MLILKVYDQEDHVPRVFKILKDPVTIGRAAYNSIVIDDPHVSMEHARVIRREGVWIIEDTASANGILAGGQKRTEVRIDEDIELSIGPVRVDAHLKPDDADSTQEIDLAPVKRRFQLSAFPWKTHLACLGLIGVVVLLSYFMSATRKDPMGEWVAPFLILGAVAYGAAGFFSVFSKIQSKRYQFSKFLPSTTFLLFAWALYGVLEDSVRFNLGTGVVTDALGVVWKAGVVYFSIVAIFRTLLPHVSRRRLLASVGLVVLAGTAGIAVIRDIMGRDLDGYANYGPVAYPILPLSWKKGDFESWQKEMLRLAAKVEENRKDILENADWGSPDEDFEESGDTGGDSDAEPPPEE